MIETDWEVHKVLHAMWKLFNESPARRDIYIQETGCDIFPCIFAGQDGLRMNLQQRSYSNMAKHCPGCETLIYPCRKISVHEMANLLMFKLKYHMNQLMLVKFHFLLPCFIVETISCSYSNH